MIKNWSHYVPRGIAATVPERLLFSSPEVDFEPPTPNTKVSPASLTLTSDDHFRRSWALEIMEFLGSRIGAQFHEFGHKVRIGGTFRYTDPVKNRRLLWQAQTISAKRDEVPAIDEKNSTSKRLKTS